MALLLAGVALLGGSGASPACAQEVGAIAADCQDGGGTPGPCFGEETAHWEMRAEAALVALRGLLQWRDEDRGGLEPEWMATERRVAIGFQSYRDAICDADAMARRDLPLAGPTWAECRMELTAAYALRLERMGEAAQ